MHILKTYFEFSVHIISHCEKHLAFELFWNQYLVALPISRSDSTSRSFSFGEEHESPRKFVAVDDEGCKNQRVFSPVREEVMNFSMSEVCPPSL